MFKQVSYLSLLSRVITNFKISLRPFRNLIFSVQSNFSHISKPIFFLPVCFKVFDTDRDGKLSRSEVSVMLRCMKDVSRQTGPDVEKIFDENDFDVDVEAEADALLNIGGTEHITQIGQFLSIEDYLVRKTSRVELFQINGQLFRIH